MLRRHRDMILLNTIDPALITNVTPGVGLTIEGYGDLTVAGQIASHKTCTSAGTDQITTVDVAIPTSCECPYEWCLTIECKPDLFYYEVQSTFPAFRTYCYEDPAGGTPTASATAAAIAASINADPFACVTATVVGTVITITGKPGVCYNAFTASGTVAVTTPFVAPVIDDKYMCKTFPIQWGMQGAKPNLPIPGEEYCQYCFTIRLDDIQDVDGANHWNKYEKEVCFFVRANDPNFAAFDGPVAGLIPIANGGTL